jgi:hypothetical protein
MSFESCPACGYALSTIDHQCRHCHSALKAVPVFKRLDLRFMALALLAAGIIIFLCRIFLFR